MAMQRTTQKRELDLLTIGERVTLLHGVRLVSAEVVRVGSDFTYRDYTAPLGYYVVRDGYSDAEGNFESRDNLFRETERPELIARLEDLRDCIDHTIGELVREVTCAGE